MALADDEALIARDELWRLLLRRRRRLPRYLEDDLALCRKRLGILLGVLLPKGGTADP